MAEHPKSKSTGGCNHPDGSPCRRITSLLSPHSNATYPSLQSRIVCIPGDHRDAEVAGQLQEVLRRGRRAPEELRVGQVEDGGDVSRQEVLAEAVEDLCNGKREGRVNATMQPRCSHCTDRKIRNMPDINHAARACRLLSREHWLPWCSSILRSPSLEINLLWSMEVTSDVPQGSRSYKPVCRTQRKS